MKLVAEFNLEELPLTLYLITGGNAFPKGLSLICSTNPLMKDTMCVCVRDMCEPCCVCVCVCVYVTCVSPSCSIIMHVCHSKFHEIIVQPNSCHSSVNAHLSYPHSGRYGVDTRSSLRLCNYSDTHTRVGTRLNTASHTSM